MYCMGIMFFFKGMCHDSCSGAQGTLFSKKTMLTDDIVTIPCVYELQIWSEMMNHHFQTMRKAKYMQILVFISFLVKRLLYLGWTVIVWLTHYSILQSLIIWDST